MYYTDGFIKKFPLDKPTITLGRNTDNDLIIKEDFISRNHVRVINHEDYIIIKDLGSTNGINFRDEKVKEAIINIGESFILGKLEFILKRGTLDEFKLAKELIPIFDTIGIENETKYDNIATRQITDVYSEILKIVMQIGMKKNDFKEFLLDLPTYLSSLIDVGSLFIISKNENDFDIYLSITNDNQSLDILKKLVKSNTDIYTTRINASPIPSSENRLYAFPLKSEKNDTTLLFLMNRLREKEENKVEEFLTSLVIEMDLFSQLLTGKTRKNGKPEPEHLSPEDIVAESTIMKELIKQAKKIAESDIFVLIQGESGTGKELFARMIHKYSGRKKDRFVAINCAAIPEDLLESELFGHEKGAFTGAYTQRKGKLEIASDGTLVLDEIGDMPFNLQSKLLRALQEKEFYRLGGSTPITVDLRIISITNRDLKQLISNGKFREDLYYRLVHRIITIPPLRDRKEDISALINFFTLKFCQQGNKKINGYSVKAFEALQNYNWKGNVRQLENEIRSIVNLTDDGETVSYDILSDEVKEIAQITDLSAENVFTDENENPTAEEELLPIKMDREAEKTYILKVLEKHQWNKSRAAKFLDMTYRGLHKKMKRMGIDKEE